MRNSIITCENCTHEVVCGVLKTVDNALLEAEHFDEDYMDFISITMAEKCQYYCPITGVKEKK
jgi:hypothetical protein